jgi:cell division protein ZapA
MEEFAISVNIAGRAYRLYVEAKDEENVRKAAVLINDKVNEFAGNYAYKDKQDLLAMTALMNTSELLQTKAQSDSMSDTVFDKLKEIEVILAE